MIKFGGVGEEISIGILSRFTEIMSANVRSLLETSKQPDQALSQYMRSIQMDLGALKAETASVEAEELRSRRALEECRAEISKLQRYAEKSVEAGEDERALGFLEKKAVHSEKLADLEASYARASDHVVKMKKLQLKLNADVEKLEAKQLELQEKQAEVEALNRKNAPMTNGSTFAELEAKIDQALNEALALAELKARPKDFDDEFREWEESRSSGKAGTHSPVDELAALKDKQNN